MQLDEVVARIHKLQAERATIEAELKVLREIADPAIKRILPMGEKKLVGGIVVNRHILRRVVKHDDPGATIEWLASLEDPSPILATSMLVWTGLEKVGCKLSDNRIVYEGEVIPGSTVYNIEGIGFKNLNEMRVKKSDLKIDDE